MRTKLIEYAYPTSTTAQKAGYNKTGCWFVCVYPTENFNQDKKPETLAYFAKKEDAIKYAESMPIPYNWLHRYFN